MELSRWNPTGRFTGLADIYARCRPSYPAEAVDWAIQHCGLGPGSVVIDVGCGTGISSRLFARRGPTVIGVEPNADMRAKAAAEPADVGAGPIDYRAGRAEATGLPAGSADAVLAAQAFHWFEPDAALREFHRLLKPGGWIVLMWNERDESDPFTAAYGTIVRLAPEAAAVEGPRGRAGDTLLSHPLFRNATEVDFHNAQALAEEELLGRFFSASYAPREPKLAQRCADELRALFAANEREHKVVLHYVTSVYAAHRAD